jgi:predicted ATP-binding protein involved in virulence
MEAGEVVPLSEQGATTIELVDLNRRELLLGRAKALADTHAQWLGLDADERAQAPVRDALLEASLSFAAIRRQFVATWAREEFPSVARAMLIEPIATSARAQLADEFEIREREREAYSVTEDTRAARRAYFGRARLIERIAVRNFKPVGELELSVNSTEVQRAPWLVLLGENGTGKSAVLQAITLTLMDEAQREALGLDPASLIRQGSESARVEVQLTGSRNPTSLEITRDGFRSGGDSAKTLLLAYGATRLLPRTSGKSVKDPGVARVDNLFDPFVALADATEWLLSLNSSQFSPVARALKRLLSLDEEIEIRRSLKRRTVGVTVHGLQIPFAQLSDGYQAVVALAIDVMSVMLRRWKALEVAEGVVALDELGAHLHPRWQMTIVDNLRAAFPRVQFIASTHDPLCLRGLEDGEVAVLRSQNGDIVPVTDLPSVKGLRVDQLLTSAHFGLNSTIDPTLDRLFERYYALRSERSRTQREEREYTSLQKELERCRLLGANRRERLMLEAADDFLAAERSVTSDQRRSRLQAETRKRIRDLWSASGPSELSQ